mmetsp:Transcript_25304/g.41611  ORF Transcript_25304/g.41611 Transcript_25304/m.41611 type:complete len:773 (+) Transcript_25304:71-2389(+)
MSAKEEGSTESSPQPDAAVAMQIESINDKESLRDAIRKQVSYYFSKQNLSQDAYLVSKMNSEGYVPIGTIASFKLMKSLTDDVALVTAVCRECKDVVVDSTGTLVKPTFTNQRTTLILRDISSSANSDEVKAIFGESFSSKISSIRSDIGDTWFVTFSDESIAQDALLFSRNCTFNGAPVKARMKSENLLRNMYFPTTTAAASAMPSAALPTPPKPYTPLPPPISTAVMTSYPPSYIDYSAYTEDYYAGANAGYNNYYYGNQAQYRPKKTGPKRFKGRPYEGDNSRPASSPPPIAAVPLALVNFPPLPSRPKSSRSSGPTRVSRETFLQLYMDTASTMTKPEGLTKLELPGIIQETPLMDVESLKPWPTAEDDENEGYGHRERRASSSASDHYGQQYYDSHHHHQQQQQQHQHQHRSHQQHHQQYRPYPPPQQQPQATLPSQPTPSQQQPTTTTSENTPSSTTPQQSPRPHHHQQPAKTFVAKAQQPQPSSSATTHQPPSQPPPVQHPKTTQQQPPSQKATPSPTSATTTKTATESSSEPSVPSQNQDPNASASTRPSSTTTSSPNTVPSASSARPPPSKQGRPQADVKAVQPEGQGGKGRPNSASRHRPKQQDASHQQQASHKHQHRGHQHHAKTPGNNDKKAAEGEVSNSSNKDEANVVGGGGEQQSAAKSETTTRPSERPGENGKVSFSLKGEVVRSSTTTTSTSSASASVSTASNGEPGDASTKQKSPGGGNTTNPTTPTKAPADNKSTPPTSPSVPTYASIASKSKA